MLPLTSRRFTFRFALVVVAAMLSLLGVWGVFTLLQRPGNQPTTATAQPQSYQATVFEHTPPMHLPGADVVASEIHGALHGVVGVTDVSRAQANIQQLRRQGLLLTPTLTPTLFVSYTWPVQPAAGYDDPGFYAIGNLVDHNVNYPGFVLDYQCGDRTWDMPLYNHTGTDILPWPFPWNQMYDNAIEVVAAADGYIVEKRDDDPNDQNCFILGDLFVRGNYIAIAHADGAVSWYAHMKHGSLTTKGEMESVVAGEYLGIVGSSGTSTGPHLHFELHGAYDPFFFNAPRLDPFAGQCNLLNPDTGSLWVEQLPYYDSGINKLTVGSKPPIFQLCPEPSEPNDEAVVNAGQILYFSAYHRALLASQTTTYTVYQPDGAPYTSWIWPAPWSPPGSEFDLFEARTWFKYIEPTAPVGLWTFEALFNGTTYTHTFELLPPPGDNKLFISPDSAGVVGDVAFGPEDVLIYDLNSETWSMFFDGSDVGVTANMDAFVRYGGYLILSFAERTQLPGIFRFIEPEDLVTFRGQTWGDDTDGRFVFYFDGSDVGLDTAEENIDAIAFNPDNQMVMSFAGAYSILDSSNQIITGTGADVVTFEAEAWYGNTEGAWSPYLHGPTMGLEDESENIDGVWISALDNENYISTAGPYVVPGLVGDDDDIIVCVIEEGSGCSWAPFFDEVSFGIDGLYLEPALEVEGYPSINNWR